MLHGDVIFLFSFLKCFRYELQLLRYNRPPTQFEAPKKSLATCYKKLSQWHPHSEVYRFYICEKESTGIGLVLGIGKVGVSDNVSLTYSICNICNTFISDESTVYTCITILNFIQQGTDVLGGSLCTNCKMLFIWSFGSSCPGNYFQIGTSAKTNKYNSINRV